MRLHRVFRTPLPALLLSLCIAFLWQAYRFGTDESIGHTRLIQELRTIKYDLPYCDGHEECAMKGQLFFPNLDMIRSFYLEEQQAFNWAFLGLFLSVLIGIRWWIRRQVFSIPSTLTIAPPARYPNNIIPLTSYSCWHEEWRARNAENEKVVQAERAAARAHLTGISMAALGWLAPLAYLWLDPIFNVYLDWEGWFFAGGLSVVFGVCVVLMHVLSASDRRLVALGGICTGTLAILLGLAAAWALFIYPNLYLPALLVLIFSITLARGVYYFYRVGMDDWYLAQLRKIYAPAKSAIPNDPAEFDVPIGWDEAKHPPRI